MTYVLRAAALLAFLLAGCGSGGGQNRPLMVGSFPPNGGAAPTGLTSIRLDFDDEVSIFRLEGVLVSRDNVAHGVVVFQEPGEPQSIRLSPLPGGVFEPGFYIVAIRGGFVLNTESHYAIDPQYTAFTIGGGPPMFVGSPTTNTVRELDGTTLAPLSLTPTPGGRDPVALAAATYGGVAKVFVQLASGGGTGRSLAYFTPGDAAMTEVLLTPSPGSDLVAVEPALFLSPQGNAVFAAFRDVATQQVRLHRVRTSDGAETDVITLSPAAGAGTRPTAIALRGDLVTLLVPCRQAAGDRVVYVDLPSFTEIDRDAATPGVQAALLGGPAGPADMLVDFLAVASTGAATANVTFLALGADTVLPDASVQVGAPTAELVTFDNLWVLEGLGGPGAAPNLLAVRPGADGTADAPLPVSDLVGLVPQGTTAVRALAHAPSARVFWALLDADVLARFAWDAAGVFQDDLDPATAGLQAQDLAASAPGATCLTVATAYPP